MYDSGIVKDILQKISSVIETITERASAVKNPNELLCSPGGMMRLDAICMNLIALGEAVKGLDKQTHGELFPQYPEMYWSGVMRMRDKILTSSSCHPEFFIEQECYFLMTLH